MAVTLAIPAIDGDGTQPPLSRSSIHAISLRRESDGNALVAARSADDVVIRRHVIEEVTMATTTAGEGVDGLQPTVQLAPAARPRSVEGARAQQVRRLERKQRQLLAELRAARVSLEAANRRLTRIHDAVQEFVDGASHELRTPLTVIKEFASIVRDGLAGETTDQQREYLEIVVTRADDLGLLVDDMLDITNLEAGMLGIHREDCHVGDILERVRPLLERRTAASNIALAIQLANPLPRVFCDPEKVARIVVNLVLNAVKSCGEKGAIALIARPNDSAGEVVLSVADNGMGIAPEFTRQLFQQFRQVRGAPRLIPKGLGLGLRIVKELVDVGLGDVGVESEVGKGSTFSFTVPFAEPRTLIRRYVSRLGAHSPVVSLLHGFSDANGDRTHLDQVGHVLNRIARHNDLLLRVEPHRWVACFAADAEYCESKTRAMQHALAAANRGRPGPPLPECSVEALGSWHARDEREELIEQFEAIVAGTDAIHV